MYNIYIFLKDQLVAHKLGEYLTIFLSNYGNATNIIVIEQPLRQYLEKDIVLIEDHLYDKALNVSTSQVILLTTNLYICDDPQYDNLKIIYLPFKIETLGALVLNLINNNNEIVLNNISLKINIDNAILSVTTIPDKKCLLSTTEALIMQLFFASHPTVITKSYILKKIWGFSTNVETKTVESHIYNIRHKLITHDIPLSIIKNSEGFYLEF